jgi:lysophospholipase L1-like esterase
MYQPEEILGDGVHPTKLGHELMAKHIVVYLKDMMEG